MTSTVAHRHSTVAFNSGTATVAGTYATRTCSPTVAHRYDLPRSRAHAPARAGEYMRTMGTVVTVCDGTLRRGPDPAREKILKIDYFCLEQHRDGCYIKNNETAPRHSGTVAGSDYPVNHVPISSVDAFRGIPDDPVVLCESETHDHYGHGGEVGGGVKTRIEAREGCGQRTVKNGKRR